jgi:hypothetical protein
MSSVLLKQTKIKLRKIICLVRLVPPALPAFIMLLFAARWQPLSDSAEFPEPAFQNKTAVSRPGYRENGRHGETPGTKTVPAGPGLPAEFAPPGEIAGAFYRAARENADSAGNPALSRAKPAQGGNAGPVSGQENADGEPGGGGEEWRLLGLIRDTGGIERRYFKENESGRIIVITNAPEISPANTDPAGR